MEVVLQDVRYAWRILRRSPGFTIVAILSLALGIGATTAIFSVLDAVILKPLPYPQPHQIVQLWMRFTGIGIPNDHNWVSAPEFMDLQQNNSFSQVAAIGDQSFNVNFGGVADRVESAVVSPSLFQVLGVQAQHGRVFLSEEGHAGHERVVLLSDGLWKRRFGAEPTVLGRKLIMNGESYQIVGVLPRGFQFPPDAEVWTPLVFSADDLSPNSRGGHGLLAIARIKPGLSLEQARADMAAVSRRIIEQNPGYPYKTFNFGVILVPLLEQEVGDIKTALWVLMGAVCLVLLIACGNVANLLLVRASTRERRDRRPPGLGRGSRQADPPVADRKPDAVARRRHRGIGIRLRSHPPVNRCRGQLPPGGRNTNRFRRSGLCNPGVARNGHPVRTGARAQLRRPRYQAGSSGRQPRHSGRRSAAAAHCSRPWGNWRCRSRCWPDPACSSAVFCDCRMWMRDSRPDGVLTMRISLPEQKYAKPEQSRVFYRELLDRVRRLPGVDAAGAVTGLPLSGTGWSGTATIDTQSSPAEGDHARSRSAPGHSRLLSSHGHFPRARPLFRSAGQRNGCPGGHRR